MLLQADRLAGQLLADGPAEEAVLVVDADLGQVARVVADRHRLADVGRQRQVEVAEALEADAVLLDPARLGDGQQQQVELLQRVRQARQEAARLPALLGRDARLAVDALVVVVEEERRAGARRARPGSAPASAAACTRRRVARQARSRQSWLTVSKKRSIRPRPRGSPTVEKTSRILRSAATCSRCCEVKSLPWSV